MKILYSLIAPVCEERDYVRLSKLHSCFMFDVPSCHRSCYPDSNLGVIKTYVGMQTCLPELNWPLGNAVSWA